MTHTSQELPSGAGAHPRFRRANQVAKYTPPMVFLALVPFPEGMPQAERDRITAARAATMRKAYEEREAERERRRRKFPPPAPDIAAEYAKMRAEQERAKAEAAERRLQDRCKKHRLSEVLSEKEHENWIENRKVEARSRRAGRRLGLKFWIEADPALSTPEPPAEDCRCESFIPWPLAARAEVPAALVPSF